MYVVERSTEKKRNLYIWYALYTNLPPVSFSVSLSRERAASPAGVFAPAGHSASRRAGRRRGGRGAASVLLFAPAATVVLAV